MHRSATQIMRLLAVVILAAASLAGSHAAAQAPTFQSLSAQIPAAPAGGIDSAKMPDILGIHLGMTQDVAVPMIKALYPGPGLAQPGATIVTAQYSSTPAPKWIGYVTAIPANSCASPGSCYSNEQMNATFSGPPNKGVLVGLEHIMSFQTGKNPTVDSIKAALFQKYGANPIVIGSSIYYWISNEQGGPLTPAPPVKSQDCGAVLLAPRQSILAYTSFPPLKPGDLVPWLNMRCHSLGVYVKAVISAQTGSPLALTLDVRITDTAEDMRDALAGEAYIEQTNAANQQKLQKQTQGNVPTL